MDRTVEERFIRQYIKEDRQERLLFELFSKKTVKRRSRVLRTAPNCF